jgi:hypothetical protein
MHWQSSLVTILVHICYHRNPDFREGGDQPEVLKNSHFYVSDDTLHDTLFVQHCLLLHWRTVLQAGLHPKHHIIFSYGCAT